MLEQVGSRGEGTRAGQSQSRGVRTQPQHDAGGDGELPRQRRRHKPGMHVGQADAPRSDPAAAVAAAATTTAAAAAAAALQRHGTVEVRLGQRHALRPPPCRRKALVLVGQRHALGLPPCRRVALVRVALMLRQHAEESEDCVRKSVVRVACDHVARALHADELRVRDRHQQEPHALQ